MIEQETDCEGHQKLIALMTVFKLETDYPSQGLASSLRSWRFLFASALTSGEAAREKERE